MVQSQTAPEEPEKGRVGGQGYGLQNASSRKQGDKLTTVQDDVTLLHAGTFGVRHVICTTNDHLRCKGKVSTLDLAQNWEKQVRRVGELTRP